MLRDVGLKDDPMLTLFLITLAISTSLADQDRTDHPGDIFQIFETMSRCK